MNNSNINTNEDRAASAFTKQSVIFDELYSANKIIQYKRDRVRTHVNRFLSPGSKVLELNAGTGDDAVYFGGQGHNVHATDISEGMLQKLNEKVLSNNLQDNITSEQCSFTQLYELKDKGPYDLIFSNFAGLNCTGQLQNVLLSFEPLLSKGGFITLVLLPPFCLWETLQALRGHFKLAFRRFNSANGTTAYVEGVPFTCWYYKPSFVIDALKGKYTLTDLEGLCTIVPPSSFEHFADKHLATFKRMVNLENKLCNKWPWKYIGDYYIITLRKK